MRISGNCMCSASLLVQMVEFDTIFSFFPLIVLKIVQLAVLSLRTHQLQAIVIPGIEVCDADSGGVHGLLILLSQPFP